MTTVTTHYRYKRPPRKRKAVALKVPAVVTIRDKKREADDVTPAARRSSEPTIKEAAPSSANDDRKPDLGETTRPMIVTARKPGKARRIPAGWLPDTPDEHKRRGDAADALFQNIKRQIAKTKS